MVIKTQLFIHLTKKAGRRWQGGCQANRLEGQPDKKTGRPSSKEPGKLAGQEDSRSPDQEVWTNIG
ncbi:hypothetical protein SESBI_33335 [Sesbania bispinosa]|nr:hypothetical protein SESBI_33335 [Sesbania bispinosa]